ncbi:hypothetical protein JNUCC1_00303 [Lentibacillus sp. JNUCC-1]|uniref:hypothetical protein n=1 Tax=Lentibacillus sp. JNUCC-1 TaxID=2654513 RepID=UPI0012E7571C|nr:hypothetical protein [Lentibacillus sp. JNUCC-1]MUV36500.1 hypothetical protein [Lentibacillus sp. JNUCC-1]
MMGYIMPVSHFQYQDYQVRDIKGNSRPFYVERPYKAVLEAAYEEAADSGEHEETYKERPSTNLLNQQNHMNAMPRHTVTEPNSDSFYLPDHAAADTLAEMTGKGLTFNVHV